MTRAKNLCAACAGELQPEDVDLGGPGLVAALARPMKIPTSPVVAPAELLEPDERGPFVTIVFPCWPGDEEIPDLMAFVRGRSRWNAAQRLVRAVRDGRQEWHRYRLDVVTGEIRSASVR